MYTMNWNDSMCIYDLYVFDTEKLTWANTKIQLKNDAEGMFIDHNEVLTLKLEKNRKLNKRVFFRVPLK